MIVKIRYSSCDGLWGDTVCNTLREKCRLGLNVDRVARDYFSHQIPCADNSVALIRCAFCDQMELHCLQMAQI